MTDEIQYRDLDGKPCSLDTLCRKEPEWAASRLRVELATIKDLQSRLEETERARDAAHALYVDALKRGEDLDLANSAMHAIREACNEIMGGNTSFVDDDFARCLLKLRDENKALSSRLDSETKLREIAEAMTNVWRREVESAVRELDEASPMRVCARCGKQDRTHRMMIEEGDEWECPPCWERCEAQERAQREESEKVHAEMNDLLENSANPDDDHAEAVAAMVVEKQCSFSAAVFENGEHQPCIRTEGHAGPHELGSGHYIHSD